MRGTASNRCAARIAASLLVAAAAAIGGPAEANPLGGAAPPLGDARLASLRGGFQAAGGLLLSFGIVRTVAIDGVPVLTTSLVGATNDAGALSGAGGALPSIRSGGDTAGATIAAAGTVTLVQNALDGRRIQTTTVIDATVNSLSLLRQSALQSSLRGAVIDSLRR